MQKNFVFLTCAAFLRGGLQTEEKQDCRIRLHMACLKPETMDIQICLRAECMGENDTKKIKN